MDELSELFKLVAEENKKKREEAKLLESRQISSDLDEIVSSLGNPFATIKPKKKKKVVKEELIIETETLDEVKQPEDLIAKSIAYIKDNSKSELDNIKSPDKDELKVLKDLVYKLVRDVNAQGGGGEVNLAFMEMPITSVTTSSYSAILNDYYIGVNYAGAVSITLPTADREGKVFIVKDELGEASKGTNRYITVLPSGSDLIDGRDKAILAYDYGSLTFIWKNNSWRVI